MRNHCPEYFPDTEVSAAFREAVGFMGLEVVHTGGGCTALELRHSDESYTLVTVDLSDGDCCFAPVSLSEPVVTGHYMDGETPVFQSFPTLSAALLEMYGPIAGEPLPAPLSNL